MRKGALAAVLATMVSGWVVPSGPLQAAAAAPGATHSAHAIVPRHQPWPSRPAGASLKSSPVSPRTGSARPRTGSAGPAVAPRSIPAQFLQDTSFSAGPAGQAWDKSSNGNRTLIDGNKPRTRPYSVDLCQNAASCQDGVGQLITRPGYIFSATLTYWFTLRSAGDPTRCDDVLQIGMEYGGFSTPDAGASYCPDWDGQPYFKDTIDETLFLRNMQSDTAVVYAVGFSDGAGASRYWVDDITLDIVWGTAPGQPTGLLAEPHNGSVTLHWQAPTEGTEPITAYSVLVFSGTDGSYPFNIESGTTTAVIPQLNNSRPYSFEVSAISAAGQGPYSAMSNTVTPLAILPHEQVSTKQFTLSSSDGVTWKALNSGYTQLQAIVTTTSDSMALVTANADLWTSSPGVNQDLGISVTGFSPGSTYPTVAGQPEAWKESGGSNGTFSPNAAALHAGLFLSAGSYAFTLVWKANKPSPGATIYAGAGPIGPDFSPTRLTVQLAPLAAHTVVSSASTSQFHASEASDGESWTDLGPGAPALRFVAPADGAVILAGNADLWTSTAGFNQDLAITVNGSVEAWKESGSFGGTYSPNAALVETVMEARSGVAYDAKLQWKPNRPSREPPIFAGAGPIGGKHSATGLTLLFIPGASVEGQTATSLEQYRLSGNTINSWHDTDAQRLSLSITPARDCLALLTGNADLWTAKPGINQDLGIAVSSTRGAYRGDRVGWKESGGVIGAYSPNAAYVQTAFPLSAGTAYTIRLQWRSNKPDATATIFMGAGNGAPYSPTRLTAQLFCPAAPVVASVTPATGPTTGGTTVTIAGSNLAGATLSFGSEPAGITSSSATQIIAISPAHPVGTVHLSVVTENGTSASSTADQFTYSYTTVILGDSPSIYYRFGEASGSVATDSSGNAHHASYSVSSLTLGGSGAIVGDPDTSVEFAGGAGIVQEPSGAGVPLGNTSRGFECWFRTVWTNNMWIASWGPANLGASESFGIQIAGGNRVVMVLGTVVYMLPLIPGSGNFANGVWHQLAVTYDAPTLTLTAYIDGEVLANQVIQQPLNTLAGPLKIGNMDPAAPNGNGAFAGSIDELAIYSTVLTSAQIATHFRAARGR